MSSLLEDEDEAANAFMSVRLVTLDSYMAAPVTADLDPVYSNFRSSVIYKVPVLRVFGPNAHGQKVWNIEPNKLNREGGFVFKQEVQMQSCMKYTMKAAH